MPLTWSNVKGLIGQITNELQWITHLALIVVLFALVLREFGVQVPFINVPGSAQSWVYLAGMSYLIRR